VDPDASAGTAEVKNGELFWNFASRTLDKSSGANINQQLAAVFRKNIRCFPNGRYTISEAKECRTLVLPTKEQVLAEDKDNAARMLRSEGITQKEWESVVSQIGSAKSDLAAKEEALKKAEADGKELIGWGSSSPCREESMMPGRQRAHLMPVMR